MSHDSSYSSNYHATHSSQEQEIHVSLPKKLIVCCDGTWEDSDNGYVKGKGGKPGHMQTPTNVTRIARAVKPEDDDHHPQIVFYQAGVGTGTGAFNQLVGGGTGLGLSEHIREAYGFLANNYREYIPEAPGLAPDSIFIMGFSRGAFTARSISGLLGAVGLLKKKAMPYFYQIFSDWEKAGDASYTPQFFDSYYEVHPEAGKSKPDPKLAKDPKGMDKYMDVYFKYLEALGMTQRVVINCVGVWDTVGSLGIPVNPWLQKLLPGSHAYIKEYSWFDTRVGVHVNNAFHALALDEHRYPFSPTLWEKYPGDPTNLKQVWFPGAHSNVGGSYEDTGIADITLAWMMDQLSGHTTVDPKDFKPREWIKFDEDYHQFYEKEQLTAQEKEEYAPYRGWAMGHVYESMYFPQSMLGKKVRGPGLYHRIDNATGKPSDKLLEGTNEYIHSCVRARVDMGGRGVDQDWNQVFPNSANFLPLVTNLFRKSNHTYQPTKTNEPLYQWKLRDGHKSHDPPNMDIEMDPEGLEEVTWEYQGTEKCSNRILKEDKMGPFELKLIQKDPKLAKQVIYSNNDWRWRKQENGSGPKPAHTL